MVYDWGEPNFNAGGGLAYAWADKPEGPRHRSAEPITRNVTLTALLGKYRRTYAATLVRRQHDWMILGMLDNAPHSWALFAMTAPQPEGPYSERKLVRNVEGDYFHPPLMEFYPAFTHDGWVYAPATSVARNRNFQVIFRAPLERATDPEAWEIVRHGSVWHSEDVPNEAFGIWGQTFSGAVDSDGRLWAMFPSRNTEGFGTINLAVRPWSKPLNDRGFHLTGHNAPSLTLLRQGYSDFTLNAQLHVQGTARILWDYQAPLGPNQPTSDAVVNRLSLRRHKGLDLGPDGWRIVTNDAQDTMKVVAFGTVADPTQWKIRLSHQADGETALALGGKEVWHGTLGAPGGAIGLSAKSHSYVDVDRFSISGTLQPGTLSYLYTEALLGAGENPADWVEQNDDAFRYGVGAIRKDDAGRAKWNFMGSGFTLWSPKGPDFGVVTVRLDGAVVATIDLHSARLEPSQPIFSKAGLPDTFHAVALQPQQGRLVVDSLDVSN
jgi:hypothetical protein